MNYPMFHPPPKQLDINYVKFYCDNYYTIYQYLQHVAAHQGTVGGL